MKVCEKALASVEPIESPHPNGEFDVILSTKARDRDGDELTPDGWQLPLPDYIPFDIDHGMSVGSTVGGGKPFIDGQGRLRVRGTFSSLPQAQDARTLVREGIIRNVSVAYMDRIDADGKAVRELLNGSFVAVPANPEAVVLSAKAAGRDAKYPYGRQVHYADPGFRDGVHRYPLRDREEVEAAWDYFHHNSDRDQYTRPQQAHIEREIESAAREFGVNLSKSEEKRDAKEEKSMRTVKDAPHAKPGTGYQGALLAPDKGGAYSDGDAPQGASGDSDAHSQIIHDLAVTLGARCSGGNAHAGLTDGAPTYGKAFDAPHAGSGHTYSGSLEAPDRSGGNADVPTNAGGDSDAGHEHLQNIHDAAVRMGAACSDEYGHNSPPRGAMGASDANDLQHGVQAVLMNHLAKSLSLKEAGVGLHNGQGVPDALDDGDTTYPNLQMIHDAAVALGGACQGQQPPWAEDGEVWGANSPIIAAPRTSAAKSAGAPVSPALKWAADTAASPDDSAGALARAKALAIQLT